MENILIHFLILSGSFLEFFSLYLLIPLITIFYTPEKFVANILNLVSINILEYVSYDELKIYSILGLFV